MWKVLKAIALAFCWWKQKSDQGQGAELQRGKDADAREKVLGTVGKPVTRAESDELWEQNKGKFGPDQPTSG